MSCPDTLTDQVLSAAFEVANTLGAGFLEKVYQRSLHHELTARGIRSKSEAPIPVLYKNQNVGHYYADLLIQNVLIVELKTVDRLAKEHTAQCLNYLRATNLTVCLLINYQNPKLEWKRIVRGFLEP